MSQLSGTVTNLDVTGIALAELEVILCNFGANVPTAAGSVVYASVRETFYADATGNFSFTLRGNDVISPAGTYYTFTYKDEDGVVVGVAPYYLYDNSSYNLAAITPIYTLPVASAPSAVVTNPSGPQVIANYSLTVSSLISNTRVTQGMYTLISNNTPNFDWSQGGLLRMSMSAGSVTSSFFSNASAAQEVTIILIQNSGGTATMTWPSSVRSASTIPLGTVGAGYNVFKFVYDGTYFALTGPPLLDQ